MKRILICKDYECLKKGLVYKLFDETNSFSYLRDFKDKEIIIPRSILKDISFEEGGFSFNVFYYNKKKGIKKLFNKKYFFEIKTIESKEYNPTSENLLDYLQIYIQYPMVQLNKSYSLDFFRPAVNIEKIESYMRIQEMVHNIINETIVTINGATKDELEIIKSNLPDVRQAIESLFYKDDNVNIEVSRKGYFDYAKSISKLS